MIPIYKVSIYNQFGHITENKLFKGYKAAHVFEKSIKEKYKDGRITTMILYKYIEQKDGSFKEIYIGPSNW